VVKFSETSFGRRQKRWRTDGAHILNSVRQVSVQFIVNVSVVSANHRLLYLYCRVEECWLFSFEF